VVETAFNTDPADDGDTNPLLSKTPSKPDKRRCFMVSVGRQTVFSGRL
jgi:hypothetical protein